jgi:hypothetical protein
MKTSSRSILVFLACGLVGPLLRWATWPPKPASTGGDFVYDLVLLLWPTQPLAVMEATMGPVAAITLSIAANVILFGAVGIVAAAVADRLSRLIAFYVLVCLGVLLFAIWIAGFRVAFVNIGALLAAFVVYALPFVAVSRMSRSPQSLRA